MATKYCALRVQTAHQALQHRLPGKAQLRRDCRQWAVQHRQVEAEAESAEAGHQRSYEHRLQRHGGFLEAVVHTCGGRLERHHERVPPPRLHAASAQVAIRLPNALVPVKIPIRRAAMAQSVALQNSVLGRRVIGYDRPLLH